MNKTLIAAAATSVLLLAGCASSDDAATANATKLDELSNQVSQLSQDVQSLQSDVQNQVTQQWLLKKKQHVLTSVSITSLSLTLSKMLFRALTPVKARLFLLEPHSERQ